MVVEEFGVDEDHPEEFEGSSALQEFEDEKRKVGNCIIMT